MEAGTVEMYTTAGSLLVALMFAATMYTVFAPMLAGDKQKKRMKAVTSERDTMRRQRLDALQTPMN